MDTLYEWGMSQTPREACGLIVEGGAGFEVHHMLNVASEPHTGYSIDRSIIGMVVADKAVWDKSTTVWHTHPGGTVGASELDVRHAIVGLKYIVMSLPRGEVRSFSSEGADAIVTGWER